MAKVKTKTEKGIKCGFCERYIFKSLESGGKIHYKDDKPICAVSRILNNGNLAQRIQADKPKMEEDVEKRDKIVQEKEDRYIARIAAKSVLMTGTGIKKN